ncbi:FxDxF family PEP-CTERM protein [Massilia sp. YMA4]|uniref:FxDxF family PEP-CTERM protein n=1 Tax=Massilia sp. YMA4 TaxID=1593482 RepID=UPI00187767D0|nr:FxDxF family PEP-CTERM protein [Massilia sp. YMA4]
MKKIIFAATLLAVSLANAGAATISSPDESLTLVTGKNSVSFGNTFANANAGDIFTDRFYFTLANDADLSINVTSTRASTDTDLILTGVSLFDAETNTAINGKRLLTGVKEYWKLTANDLIAGDYYLAVSGKTVGAGGSFAGNGVIEVSAVPEPGTGAMLLGGLAVLGVAARRRRN